MYKKRFLLLILLLIGALSLSACSLGAPEYSDLNSAAPSTYFENGTIYTADAQDTVAEALAIEDGKIVFVGSAAEGASYRESAEEVVDLEGGMLLPGFIDAHIHSVTPEFFDFLLVDAFSLDDTLAAIESYVKANPDQDFYQGFGYYTSIFEGEELVKGPKKERLDEICADKPMFIYSYDGHAAWLNSKCFEVANITETTASTPGGEIVKDPATGELWGTLKDTAMSLLPPISLPDEELAAALQGFQAELNGFGYTSIMTLPGNGFFPVPFEGYAKLEAENKLTLRVRGAGLVTSWQTEQDIADVAALKKYDSELVKLTTAKLFLDGVVDSESALLLEPYESDPDYYGASVWTAETLNEAVAAINDEGIQAHSHAIGDGAVRMALDAAEYSQNQGAGEDYRNAITHLQLVAEEDLARFHELNVVAVAQPYWHYKEPEFWKTVEYPLLGERAETQYPLESFLDNDATLALSSDYPVTVVPNPFVALEIAVTRNMPDGSDYDLPNIEDVDDPQYLLGPEERLDVKDGIKGFTIGGAYSMFAEGETGTLEVGKSADLIVIDQDLFAVDPLAISDTQVLQTYLKGYRVYSVK